MTTKAVDNLLLMIVAGEPSGDAHAASLVRALRERAPGTNLEFFGATQQEMRAAGVESIVRTDGLGIVGLLEIGSVLPKFWRAFKALRQVGDARRPDAVILVDWPDFNLRLARAFRRRGLRVIYYISPQLWAWRAHRVRSVRRDVDLLLAILPFEPDWYAARGVRQVEFVGHPLTGEVAARYDHAEFCRRHGFDPARPLVALLPGSRLTELQRILPVQLAAASIMLAAKPDAQFVVAVAPTRTVEEVTPFVADAVARAPQLASSMRVVQHATREALAAANAAAVASGTATLEAAILETPLVVVYKTSALNWHTLRRLIDIDHFGLANLIARERIVPELMQGDLTGATLAAELLSLLAPARNAAVRRRLHEVHEQLGAGGASLRAADAVLRAVRAWKQE